ncbi:Pycsar system effector family protein [Pseudoalteromonas carrageenovora]|uniref:Pycsar system effector family protein n=1 Tax=Pseudoalteromonas carrageenovora TaxID=227 RepID=UPI00311EA68F
MIDTIRDTLSKVNDWIKYAEAKNAANIAFCSASIFGVVRINFNKPGINDYIYLYSFLVVFFLALSLLISLASFMPKLKTPWVKIGIREDNDNLLYFGHACKYSGSKYLDKLYRGKAINSENYEIELMYCEQIVVNSKVAYIKFSQFDLAIKFTISSIISPLYWIYDYWQRK